MNSLAVNTDDSFPGQYLYIQEDQYRKFFQGFLDKTGVERTFRITGKGPIDGVEFRWVKSEDGYLAYLINYNKKKVTVTLQKRGKDIETAKELIGGNSISFPLEVKPLDPLLMKIER